MNMYNCDVVTNLEKFRVEISAKSEPDLKATLIEVISESSEHQETLITFKINSYRLAVTEEEICGFWEYQERGIS